MDDDFSELELDALKELMNVGFGMAAVSLSEVIEMHVTLTVPKISRLDAKAIPDFIGNEIGGSPAYSMIEQFFFGRFSGTSFLLVPEEDGRKIAGIFGGDDETDARSLDFGSFEREVVIEIGNIIIGACVGKLAEMLKDRVSFQPPRYMGSNVDAAQLRKHLSGNDGVALVFKTKFSFSHDDAYGLLFLIASSESIRWTKQAVNDYIEGLA